MKYLTPEYKVAVIEAEDIVTASSNGYEIERTEEGNGNIQLEFSRLFG